MRVSLHRLLEETLGIGKIKSKKELEKLLADEERLEKVAKMIRESEQPKKTSPKKKAK